MSGDGMHTKDFVCKNCKNFHKCKYAPQPNDVPPLTCIEDEQFKPKNFFRYKIGLNNDNHFINFKPNKNGFLYWIDDGTTDTGQPRYAKSPIQLRKDFFTKRTVIKNIHGDLTRVFGVTDKENKAALEDELNNIIKKFISTISLTSTTSTISTTSTTSTISTDDDSESYLIKSLLAKERRPYQSIGRGVHNGVFYIGTIVEGEKDQIDVVVTSDRKIYAGFKEDNKIKKEFGLNYRFPLFADCMDFWWSHKSIEKWVYESYTVDIAELFRKIVELNKKYMIYEDPKTHLYIALDIMRSYFFPLFPANSRTYFHSDPGSGKTNQIMIYDALAFNPITSADFSSASIYRIIESTGGTILVDDFDLLPDEQKNAIIQHIRVNYKKFKTIRADGNRKNRPYAYNSYSHLVFNNVYGLGNDDITTERIITIRLLKHPEARDLVVNPEDPVWKPIRDDLHVCVLQYWKDVKDCYDKLKIDDFEARELELIKPILAIAKVIDEEVYHEVLGWYKDLLKREKVKDLKDDWEYNLLRILWKRVKDLGDKEPLRVFVKDLADELLVELYPEIDDPNKRKKILRKLCVFVGKRLKSYIIFKSGMTDGCSRYDIYKEGILKILRSKGFGIKKSKDGVDVVDVVDVGEAKRQKNLENFSKNDFKERYGRDSPKDVVYEYILNHPEKDKIKITNDLVVMGLTNYISPVDLDRLVDDCWNKVHEKENSRLGGDA
ncbi:MAG TPA: hypothetical protein ENI49_04145 [Thermoplasmatales archaeon]|nr:hypothetical protein [Thermoplasmatales archaeon]